MNRRRLLATLAGAGLAGLAGCGGSVSDSSQSCSEVSADDLSTLLPPGDGTFSKVSGGPSSVPNAQDSATQQYEDGNGTYDFVVAQYGSSDLASESASTLFREQDPVGTVGYVINGRYVFAVNAHPEGGGETEIENLLVASPALNDVCVDTQVSYQ